MRGPVPGCGVIKAWSSTNDLNLPYQYLKRAIFVFKVLFSERLPLWGTQGLIIFGFVF